MNSAEIIALLKVRHVDDVFVTECKDGPSQQTGKTHIRMDAWVMSKSWSNPHVWAYEVKTTRGDFLKDNKWRQYLKCCNTFYFVCPQGVINPDELPKDVGLMYVTSTGRGLRIIKKAPWRNQKIDENLFRYILMCRTQIVAPTETVSSTMTKSDRMRDREEWPSTSKIKPRSRKKVFAIPQKVRDK